MSGARVYVIEYRVTAWPEDLRDHPGGHAYDVIIRPTFDPDLWVITTRNSDMLLTLGGNWSFDIPSGFRRRHYRPLDRALADARVAAEALQPLPITRDEHVARIRGEAP